jgi:hypothetical protein
MSKKVFVFFTEVITILSEAGEKKLERATAKKPSDEHDLDFYDRLGLRPPKDLEEDESEIYDEGFMKLKEGEYTYDFLNHFFDISDFFSAVEGDEFGTIISFKNGSKYLVDEDIIEVYARIHFAQRSWSERVYDSIVEFFSRKKEIG